MKLFLKNNINLFVYFIFSLIIELYSLYNITGKLTIYNPLFLLSLFSVIFFLINLFKRRVIKNIIIYTCFIIKTLICMFCCILYESTGTVFEFGMLRLLSEAATFASSVSLNYVYLIVTGLIFLLFILLVGYLNKYIDKVYSHRKNVIFSSVCLLVFFISHISSIIITNQINKEKFVKTLYINSNEKYNNLGVSGNFINEIYKIAFFNKYNDFSYEEIEEYIYSEVSTPTSMFGVSKDNNLVTILVESFEWFSFISDPNIYPNNANLNEEQLDFLFPNLRSFYNNSVVMNNHYVQNKTDISEIEALLGSYPNSDYVNYGYATNTLPSSIANSLKIKNSSISNNFFHNNTYSFYNRNIISSSLGYENTYFIEEMVYKGVNNNLNNSLLDMSKINLDSEMILAMKDEMFFADKRFNTHITSISMHGEYSYKKCLNKWYEKLNSLNVEIKNSYLRNYMAAVMEFDYALGLIIEDLENKNLLNKTTIVLFSDHNTYINKLTNHVKNIYNFDHPNYTELYRVPLMIYDPSIGHQIINKFTTTYDITPTILDMFGISYYTNLYYGNSIFSDKESILYSKVFNIFMKDNLYFSNIKNILYKKEEVDNQHIEKIEKDCLYLLGKIYYTNHIFYYDYFNKLDHNLTFINKLKSIN